MLFTEDAMFFSFLQRYDSEEDRNELKDNLERYAKGGNPIDSKRPAAIDATKGDAEGVDDVSPITKVE